MGESWGPQASPVLPSCGVSKCGVVRGHWHSSPTRRHLEAVAAAVTGPVIAAWSSRDCSLRREAAALAAGPAAHGGRVVVFVRCTSPLFVPCSRRRLERESRGPGRAAVTGGTGHNGRATEPAEPQSPASLSCQHQHMQVHAGNCTRRVPCAVHRWHRQALNGHRGEHQRQSDESPKVDTIYSIQNKTVTCRGPRPVE